MRTSSELRSIRLFLRKGLIFVVPFLAYAALLVLIDPFNYFNVAHVIEVRYKRESAGKLHYPLWKILVFQHEPKPNIFLGDSRMGPIRDSTAEQLTGNPYHNLSYGGGTVPEMVDTFWFVSEQVKLQKVFIGIGFINLNQFQSMNRVREVKAMLSNPLLYLTNRTVSKAAVYSVIGQLSGKTPDIEKPPLDRDAFWRYQLGEPTRAHFSRYKYSLEHLRLLRDVADYCAEEGIALTFVIPPSHVDLQEMVAKFGMAENAKRFGQDLRSLGRVIDFNFPNAFTKDRSNFSDPYHFIPKPFLVEAILADTPDPLITR